MIKRIITNTIKTLLILFLFLTIIGVIQLKMDFVKITDFFHKEIDNLNDRYNQVIFNDYELLKQIQEQARQNNLKNSELLEKITILNETIKDLKANNVNIDNLLNSDVYRRRIS